MDELDIRYAKAVDRLRIAGRKMIDAAIICGETECAFSYSVVDEFRLALEEVEKIRREFMAAHGIFG